MRSSIQKQVHSFLQNADALRALRYAQFVLPAALFLLAVVFEMNEHSAWSFEVKHGMVQDILFFGVVGPLAVALVIGYVHYLLMHTLSVERRMVDTQRHLAAVTQNSADAILSLSTQGIILSWNRGAENLFGQPAAAAIGLQLTQIMPTEPQRFTVLLDEIAQKGVVREQIIQFKSPQGKARLVDVTLTSLPGTENGEDAISAIFRDITERLEHQHQIEQLNAELARKVETRTRELAERNQELEAANQRLQELDRLKSEFLSMVNHQLRAPLTNMRGAVELMQNRCKSPNGTCAQMHPLILGQIDRLGNMVKRMLDVSRIEAGVITLDVCPVDLMEVLTGAFDSFEPHASFHRLRLMSTEQLFPPVLVDALQLQEVFTNLIDNALKYSPDDAPVEVTWYAEGDFLAVRVKDHGQGIPQKQQKRIFEKFHRIDGSDAQTVYGYGLGLFICKYLVEAMNGKITLESDEGKGSTFTVFLPVAVNQVKS